MDELYKNGTHTQFGMFCFCTGGENIKKGALTELEREIQLHTYIIVCVFLNKK